MRVSSERPYTMKDGSIGYWHSFDGTRPRKWVPTERKEPPKIDAEEMINSWVKSTTRADLKTESEFLGVSLESLVSLKCCWSEEWQSWAFPMRNGGGKVCGIRLRFSDGRKLAVTGSRQGNFIPWRKADKRVFLVEGPTDTAAMLTIGLFCIGRPSCGGGVLELKQTVHLLGIEELVIIADNDKDKFAPDGRKFNPGMDGAESLIRQIPVKSCIITMPTKDIRDFVKHGGTAADVEDIVKNAIWENTGLR